MINYMAKLVDRATYSEGRSAPPRGRKAGATGEQIGSWRALARAFAAATRVQEAALAGTGLDLSEYDVLVTLAGAPADGMRPTELADRVLLTKSGTTRLLDRLVERTLIARHACPLDRRGQLVALTPEGRHLLRRAAPAMLRALATALAPLTGAELGALRRASESITEASTAHSAG